MPSFTPSKTAPGERDVSYCRIFASLIGPLDDFVRVIEGAAGDIKIDRERDPKYDPAQGEPYSIIKAPAKPSKPAK